MTGKDHAIHNEETCDFLLSSGKYNDWVVTTAFYSALHYICYELFPLERNDEIYNNFEAYHRSNYNKENSDSKHSSIIKLINTELPSCNMFYRSLFDQCMKARYINYMVSNDFALKAKRNLDNIKRQLHKI